MNLYEVIFMKSDLQDKLEQFASIGGECCEPSLTGPRCAVGRSLGRTFRDAGTMGTRGAAAPLPFREGGQGGQKCLFSQNIKKSNIIY